MNAVVCLHVRQHICMTCIACTCWAAWKLVRRVCVCINFCICEGLVVCIHDSLDTGPNVRESHSCWGGLRAGSPQCYSSCQLRLPSPVVSAPSLPLMPSECFPFRSLPCFLSIAPDGSVCRETKTEWTLRRRACVGRELGIFLFFQWPSCFPFSDWPLVLRCSLFRVIYICLIV